jgi:hypothetical protein
VKVDGAKNAVERAASASYHGDRPVFEAPVLDFLWVKVAFHIHQMICGVGEFV